MELLNLRPDHTPKKIKSTSSPETNMKPPPDKACISQPNQQETLEIHWIPIEFSTYGGQLPELKITSPDQTEPQLIIRSANSLNDR